jgi:hypothetical protein
VLLVDLLEAVDVDRDHGEALAVGLELAAQALVEAAVVGQTRERVGRRELLEALALVAQERDGAVEAVGEVAELAGADGIDVRVEVALLEAAQPVLEPQQRAERGVAQHPGDPGAEAGGQDDGDRDGDERLRAAGPADGEDHEAQRRDEDEQPQGDRDGHLDEKRSAAIDVAACGRC